jgi:ATP-dependent DNA helicase RecG
MEMVHPKVHVLGPNEELPASRILPIYPLSEGLKQAHLRGAIGGLLPILADLVTEVIPERILQKLDLPTIGSALRELHQPTSEGSLRYARRRFVLQELLVLQLALALQRRQITSRMHSPTLTPDAEIEARIRRRFPFKLTEDQNRACREVGTDMSRQFPMNRLLQGDVGSGKTVVALYAMLLAVAHRHQSLMMAPTEILARQHYESLDRALRDSRVRVGFLAGSQTVAERRKVIERASAGEIDVLVGTQALLYGQVKLPKLGLVVIDEQHKFGVRERAALRGGGFDPHYLVLSATPIPRTLAMTMLADLDVTTLREKPPGRGKLHTYLAKDGWRERWWQFVAQRLAEGRQAFVVAPQIGNSVVPGELLSGNQPTGEAPAGDVENRETDASVSTVQRIFQELKSGPLAEARVGLLHGRLPAEEKQEAIERFVQGRTQVLVSTTVIEVGIDVPNATVMTIFGAERFGLAQLHQLRGRVARGGHPGYVCLFTDREENPAEIERLRVFAETDDGFALAEADFRLRGPGNFFGVRQSGLPPLRIADLLQDQDECLIARQLALDLVEDDPDLNAADLQRLKKQMLRRYGNALQLGDVA